MGLLFVVSIWSGCPWLQGKIAVVRGLTKTVLMHIELPYYNGPCFFPFPDAPACNIMRIRVIRGRAYAFGVTLEVDLIYTTNSVVSLSLKRDK